MSKDEKTFAMLCHLGGFAGFVFPFGNILAPLIIWIMKKEEYPFVDEQGRESLNFQISIIIYAIISLILMLVVVGFFSLIIIGIMSVVFPFIGAIKANDGESFRYPLTIRFL